MKCRLNKRTIDEAVYEGSSGCYLWDTELACFGLRIYPTGRKSFVVSYWSQGKRRFLVLGQYGKMTLHQAREAALEVFLRVRRGEDPAGDRQTARRAPSMTDLADRHVREHSEVKKKPKNAKRDRNAWDRLVLPRLAHRKVRDVARVDMCPLLA